MTHLWPYYQTKNKAFFRDGNKKAVLTRIGNIIEHSGDRINKFLDLNIGETVHIDKFELKYSK